MEDTRARFGVAVLIDCIDALGAVGSPISCWEIVMAPPPRRN